MGDHRDLTDNEFRALLNLHMAADPTPVSEQDDAIIEGLLHRQSVVRGFDGWVEAYHRFEPQAVSS